ncbi:MAG: UPF0182 family protein [Syntrophorhabdaceae bacterium]|nr:UPF0182 family protein [Syntrophorhabdaceae bacterium]
MLGRFGRLLIISLILIFILFGTKVTSLYVDGLFFQETGYFHVFTKTLLTKIFAALTFGISFFLFIFINGVIACRASLPPVDIILLNRIRIPVDPKRFLNILNPLNIVIAILGGFLGLFLGGLLWEDVLTFLNYRETGILDPVFNRDLGFYLFRLFIYQSLNRYGGFILIVTLLLTIFIYLVRGGIIPFGDRITSSKKGKYHICLLIFLFFIKVAFGFYLDRFDTLYSTHSVITGAGYSDVYGRLIVLNIMPILTIIGGFFFCYGLWKENWKKAIYLVLLLFLIYFAGVIVYPALLQNFKVSPNEQALEEPFIKKHIEMTRYGYNLDKVHVVPFEVSFNLTGEEIKKNDATIKNIRLWDEAPLLKTYGQLQQIRTYYRFHSVDNDRYTINGEYRQVMLSARELSYDDLPSKSWINERLVFTHGNGIVMGHVSKISREGLPEFIVKDIPPSQKEGIHIKTPELYYGERTNDYVIVNTKVPEFSYPTTEGNIYTSYKGTGGIKLDSFMKKALFAFHFRTAKILLSGEIRDESRIIYYRNIVQRAQKIAPFLYYDSDPYIVALSDGKLYWIIDAYTTSTHMPYSKPLKNRVNYMRNSVKVVVDAYSGKMTFYLYDADDTVAKVYGSIFPGLLKPAYEMPDELRRHIRYPLDFFKVQTSLYAIYHMDDPKVFYNKEDLWEIPRRGDRPMEPYYLIMKLPDEKKEEYVVLMPYTPSKRDNLAAWFAARCDEPNYGKLIVYTFPRDRLVFGPRQIDARIDQDSYISQQLTLWGQRGSQVIRGSLLIIPIEKSLLYIQPLYLAAEDKGGLPELRRVIMAYENHLVMEENLEQCLSSLFGRGKSGPPERLSFDRDKTKKTSQKELAKEALNLYEKAKDLLRQGDFGGYGDYIKRLEQILKEMASN